MMPVIPRAGVVLAVTFALAFGLGPVGCAVLSREPAAPGIAGRTTRAQENEIEALLRTMSPIQKVGQLLMIGIDGTELTPTLADVPQRHQPGGVIIFRKNVRSAAQVAALTNALQRASIAGGARLPLLVATDQEGGTVSQIPAATEFPDLMALAASGSEELVERVAQASGAELRALGIAVNLAPVLDVNSNPLNPVIGIRSFGDDPERVARFGRAYVRGLHAAGVVAVAKHFPGHGETDLDTHVTTGRVDLSESALERSPLVPFRAALGEGIDMVMPAHLAVPALSGSATLPVTYSRGALTGFLRDRMGFRGVVITDSLQMTAARQGSFADAAVRAVRAGADVLLLPGPLDDASGARVDVASAALLASVSGDRPDRLLPDELDAAVRRVLLLKKGLHAEFTLAAWTVDEAQAARAVRAGPNLSLAREAAVRGLAWLKPLPAVTRERLAASRELLVLSPVLRPDPDDAMTDRYGDYFGEALAESRGDRRTVVVPVPFLRGRRPPTAVDPGLLTRLRTAAARADAIVAGLARPEHLELLQAIQEAAGRDVPIAVVQFGSPYPAAGIREPVAAILATFSMQREVFGVAARAMHGDVEVTGRPPVAIGRPR